VYILRLWAKKGRAAATPVPGACRYEGTLSSRALAPKDKTKAEKKLYLQSRVDMMEDDDTDDDDDAAGIGRQKIILVWWSSMALLDG
jgi:hypothetical protein